MGEGYKHYKAAYYNSTSKKYKRNLKEKFSSFGLEVVLLFDLLGDLRDRKEASELVLDIVVLLELFSVPLIRMNRLFLIPFDINEHKPDHNREYINGL